MTNRPLPDIDEAFRNRVNEIYEAWHQNTIPFAEASQHLEALRQEALEDANALNEAGIYNILGIIHGYRSKYDNSIINFDRARAIYENEGALRRTATVDLNLGETYRLLGNFTRAKSYFHKAYEGAKSFEDVALQVVALGNEGQMWISLKSYDKARETLEKALDLGLNAWQADDDRNQIRRADQLCEVYHALASIELQAGQTQVAWDYAVASYENAEYSGRILRMGYANRILGDVVTELGNAPHDEFTDNIDYYYDEAMSAFKQVKAEGEVGKTLLSQGQSLAKRGKKRAAINKYQQAMVIFTRLGMMDDAAEAAQAQTTVI
ncbi:MAG: tetratricopeptide repeat protein [Chloroflexota bacterium]